MCHMGPLVRGAILLTATVLFGLLVVHNLLFAVSVPLTYDYIVVGGGSTGSVVAGRLGQAGYSVLVLEAGGPTQRSLGGGSDPILGEWTIFDVPLGWVQVLSDHRWSKEFQWDVPADPPPAIARGLGGCGIHNAMLYMRGRPEDFTSWGEGWSWDEVLPFYLRSEDNTEWRNSSLHGTDGPVRVTGVSTDAISSSFVHAAVKAGHASINDFNGPLRKGAGFYQFMIRDGVRDSAGAAYLGGERQPPTVVVKAHALATRLLFQGNRAIGVEYVRGRAPTSNAPRLRASARHEIIVAAGAVMTPKLLLLSGIGDQRHLAKHGIPLQAHSPAVGMSLADGVYAIMQWSTWKNSFVRCRLEGGRGRPGDAAGLGEDEMDEAGVSDDVTEVTGETDETDESDQAVSDGPLPAPRPGRAASHGQICAAEREAYQRGQRASTSLGTPGMSAGAFLRSPYAIGGEPDVQLTIHPWDKYSRTWSRKFGGIASIEIANNHPRSRGHVSLRSARFTDPPVFVGPYLRDINDSLPLLWAMRKVREIAATSPMAEHIDSEILPGAHVASDAQLLDAIACGPAQWRELGRPACDRSELAVNHLAGTCRLGDPTDPNTVVDRQLRVVGVEGLRVADASVMPRPPSGNTHATCVMIGERAAQFIIDERKAKDKRRGGAVSR